MTGGQRLFAALIALAIMLACSATLWVFAPRYRRRGLDVRRARSMSVSNERAGDETTDKVVRLRPFLEGLLTSS
jgi:hypothetical protein